MINEILQIACSTFQLFAGGFLGLLTGALLAEGFLLVPYWRALSPQQFYVLHPAYAPRLFRFFAPLTIAGPSMALASAVSSIAAADAGRWYSLAAAIMALLIVGIYFAYFKSANAAFGKGAIAEADLSDELSRWAVWHTRRTIISVAAFLCSLLALHRA